MEFHGATHLLDMEIVLHLVQVMCLKESLPCKIRISGCHTVDGDSCTFPFTYNGIEYNECTSVANNGVPWCRTATGWGNCHMSCTSSVNTGKQNFINFSSFDSTNSSKISNLSH